MGVIKSDKTASKTKINENGSFNVTLSLESEPEIINKPKDIVLLLDRSSSMNGTPFEKLKVGVSHFADIIDKSTNGQITGTLGGGTKIGIVSFSTTALKNLDLTDKVNSVKSVTNKITTSGSTNHKDAFEKGAEMLASATNEKIMIMFTDGRSNAGSEGYVEADNAKKNGITVYCMGFGAYDITALNKWASAPASDHVLVTPDFNDIEKMFEDLAVMISEPKATGVTLVDKVSPCFDITNIKAPNKGVAVMIDNQTVKWTLDDIGGTGKEKVNLEFTVKDNGTCVGVVDVNESHNYTDSEGNTINLPNPQVEILDGVLDVYEDCPSGHDIIAEGCDDYISYDAGDVVIDNIGRIVEVSTTVKNICPNKSVALAVILTELDAQDIEHSRGMKTLLIPAHVNDKCMDIKVNCIKFVVPEALDMMGSPTAMCNDRKFKVKFIANYIDSDYACCEGKI